MRAGVIDIGSSTVQLIIGERDGDEIKVLESLRNELPVGQVAFLKGKISQEVINQSILILNRYKQILKEYDVPDVRAIATTAVREARNKDIFLDTIQRKTGFAIEVLNVGDVVFYLDSFLSTKLRRAYPIHEKNLLIVELGSGSMDISLMQKGQTLMNMGLPLGTLRLKQFKARIEGTREETYDALHEYMVNEMEYLKSSLPRLRIDDVILIDEKYASTLQTVLPNPKRPPNFFRLSRKEVEQMLDIVTERNLYDAAEELDIPSELADTMDGYALVLDAMFTLSRKNYFYMLETSLKEAILANTLFALETSREGNMTHQLLSVARFLCQKYHVDIKHAEHVAHLSKVLFVSLKDILGLDEGDMLYLLLAAYLHDMGMFINNRAHHKHTEYIISSSTLFRLTDDKMKIVACIARYHRKAPPLRTHYLYNSLPSGQQILVQKLGALLRVANALDGSHKQKIREMKVDLSRKNEIILNVKTDRSFTLEKTFFLERKALFEEISGSRITLSVRN